MSPPVYGWKPPNDDEGAVSPEPGRIITFNVDLDPPSPPSYPEDSEDTVSDADRPAKKLDPDYIPRPKVISFRLNILCGSFTDAGIVC